MLKFSTSTMLSWSAAARMALIDRSKYCVSCFFFSCFSMATRMYSSDSCLKATRKLSTSSLMPGRCFSFSRSESSENISSKSTCAKTLPASSSCFR